MVKRDRNAHKGNFGKILIFAGSVGMAGAAALCAKASLRSGAGLVRFLLPAFDSPLLQILQTIVPEATCVSYMEGMDFDEYDSIAAGPGLGSETIVRRILGDILAGYSGTLVLDADALNMISASKELALLTANCRARIIMTPHVGEARRLLGNASFDHQNDEGRAAALNMISEKYSALVVLKGSGTLTGYAASAADRFCSCADETSYENGIIMKNTTGGPGMATGGSGDVLTGTIAALSGQGYSPLMAAAIGTWIHGRAGDIAAARLGEISMISSDIAGHLPAAFKTVYPS